MLQRPTLLFLACYFPPVRTVACVRTWNTAKYLARAGWDVTVVTPDAGLWRHVDDPAAAEARLRQEGIRRLATDYWWRFLAPDYLRCWNRGLAWLAGGLCRTLTRALGFSREIGWIKAAEQACSEVLPQAVDVILVSGPPFVAFGLARRLAKKLHRPYVLDYRDPWEGNPYTRHPARPGEQAAILADCAAATIVSPSWACALTQRFGFEKKIHTIPNGYDPEALARVPAHDFRHQAIVYAGSFRPPKRVITPVMVALKHLKALLPEQDALWSFHYYGPGNAHVHEEAVRHGVIDKVTLHGNVPAHEALSAVRGASVAVVITSVAAEESQADNGMVTGKIYEILGLGTPALVIAPPGSDAHAIVETAGRARAFPASQPEPMAHFVREVFAGQVPPRRCPEAYAWPNIIRQFDGVLRRVLRP